MRISALLVCLPLAILVSACNNSRYEASSNMEPNPSPASHTHPSDESQTRYYGSDDQRHVFETTTTTYNYNPGESSDYIKEDVSYIPHDMFPPRGMCRVWLPNVPPEKQPRVESCVGIRERAPDDAYIIYGY